MMFAASDDSGINAGTELKAALAAHGGRGGGNVKLAQGTAPTTDALKAIAKVLGG
jgi:alanyl-tRNA synthetase